MASAPPGTEYRFDFSGGRTCLDFVNTVSGDRAGAPRERVESYADLVAWSRQARIVDEGHARRLLAEARRRPRDAAAVLADALALREALYRVFVAAASGAEPPENDIALASAHLARAAAHRRIVRAGPSGWALGWSDPPEALDAPLWRVSASAAELLTSAPELARVRVCGLHDSRECSWLFMDQTRAGTRRWCSMKGCGNRAKARRHYERVRSGPE